MDPDLSLSILGALEVEIYGRRIDLGGMRQQIVLAALLLTMGRTVPIARLIDALYGSGAPSTARVQTQICISSLRRLFAGHGWNEAIITRSKGYLLQCPPEALDLHRYERLVAGGRQARDGGDVELAARAYREALNVWRGPTLEDIESEALQPAVRRLDEDRITVNEDCIELELGLGRHHDVVGELSDLITEHPLRERLRGQLMLALYRSGRQAEALDTYRSARVTMIDELGIEPNESLRELEHAILTSDAKLRHPVLPPAAVVLAPPVQPEVVEAKPAPLKAPVRAEPVAAEPRAGDRPAMLPTDIADFTGRAKHVHAIAEHFALAQDDPGNRAVPVVVVVGKPGVGKTALAVHAAHRIAERYPDGQLFIDMHGGDAQRIGPAKALERFLRALGVPGNRMPESLEERAETFRHLLNDRRMLIVLDNVDSEHRVLPLLPGSRRSAVLVTTQSQLCALPGAIQVDLQAFDDDQSVALLSRIVGVGRLEAEIAAAADLARLCDHLPLALRIAGARLAARPQWSVAEFVDRLDDEATRLDELKHGALGVRASISVTYDAVEDDAKRLFRRLSILDLPVFSGWTSAALLDMPLPRAQDLLDDLADARLVEAVNTGHGVHSQYRFPGLVRVFARERLVEQETAAERRTALERVLSALLYLSGQAHNRIYGGDFVSVRSPASRWPVRGRLGERLLDQPMQWLERERLTIVSAVRQAAQAGLADMCWDLAVTAVTLFESRYYLNDWRETHEVAFAAASRADNRRGQAAIRYSTGSLFIVEQRFDEARRELVRAIELFEEISDRPGRALAERNLAFLDRVGGDTARAAQRYEWALDEFRGSGDLIAAAYVLHCLAQLRLDAGCPDGAKEMLAEALDLSRQGGSPRVEAQVLHRFGGVHLQEGEVAAAAREFEEALAVVRRIGDPVGEAYALHGLAMAHLSARKFGSAQEALDAASTLADHSGERMVKGRVALGMGELVLARGQSAQALPHLRTALEIFGEIGASPLAEKTKALLSGIPEALLATIPDA